MRSVKELYGIKGMNGTYEPAAVRGRKVNLLYRAQDGECYQLRSLKSVGKNQEFYIIQEDGTKRKAYAIGSYRWSYSKEERDRVRAEELAEEKAKREHRLLVERLAGLSTEQLKALVQEYGV